MPSFKVKPTIDALRPASIGTTPFPSASMIEAAQKDMLHAVSGGSPRKEAALLRDSLTIPPFARLSLNDDSEIVAATLPQDLDYVICDSGANVNIRQYWFDRSCTPSLEQVFLP